MLDQAAISVAQPWLQLHTLPALTRGPRRSRRRRQSQQQPLTRRRQTPKRLPSPRPRAIPGQRPRQPGCAPGRLQAAAVQGRADMCGRRPRRGARLRQRRPSRRTTTPCRTGGPLTLWHVRARATLQRRSAVQRLLQPALAGKASQPCRYGDLELIQSRQQTQRTWRAITECTPDREGQEVLPCLLAWPSAPARPVWCTSPDVC